MGGTNPVLMEGRGRRKLAYIGDNLKRARLELGISQKSLALTLGLQPIDLDRYERRGFNEPPWLMIAKYLVNHPDMRYKTMPAFELVNPQMFDKSELLEDLIRVYGRKQFDATLAGISDEDIIQDLGEITGKWCWTESDVQCIKVRLGILKPYHPHQKGTRGRGVIPAGAKD